MKQIEEVDNFIVWKVMRVNFLKCLIAFIGSALIVSCTLALEKTNTDEIGKLHQSAELGTKRGRT